MSTEKNERCLAIFLRGMRGEKITVTELANEYGVSAKSIARDISEIRCFLAENRDLTGHAELVYDRSAKCYTLRIDDFLRDSETLAVIKVLIGSRAFSKPELLEIIGKLRRFTSTRDKALLDSLISKEKYHYCEVRHDCSEGVVDMLWKLAGDIRSRTEITITYYKMNRDRVTHTIRPASIMFSEYYFYLIAYKRRTRAILRCISVWTGSHQLSNTARNLSFRTAWISTRERSGRRYSSCSPAYAGLSGSSSADRPCRQYWTGFRPQWCWISAAVRRLSKRRSTAPG